MTTRVGRARHPYGYYTGGQWTREHHLINIFFLFFIYLRCRRHRYGGGGGVAQAGRPNWTFTASIDGASSDAAPGLTDEQNFGVKGPAA